MKTANIIIISIIVFILLNMIYPLLLIPELKILPAILFIFFIPGYLILRLFLNNHSSYILHKLSLIITLSISIFSIIIFISYFSKVSYLQLTIIISIIDSILIILSQFTKFKRIPLIKEKPGENKFTVYVLITITIFTSLICIYGPAITTDAMGTFPCLREYSAQKYISNAFPYYKNVFHLTVYKYDTLGTIFVLFSKLTGFDVIQAWYFLSILFTFAIIISFYFFVSTLFDNYLLEIFSFTVFFVFFGIIEGLWIFRTSPYYMVITNFILFPNALSLFLKYLKEKEKRYLLLFILLSVCIGLTHLMAIFLLLVSISSYFLVILFFNEKERIKKTILSLLPIIIFIIILIMLKSSAFEPVYQEKFKPWHVIKLTKNLYYVNPVHLFAPHYHVKPPFVPRKTFMIAFLVLPVLFRYLMKHEWARFLFSNMIVVPFILLNPIIPKFFKFIGTEVTFVAYGRLSQILPIIPVLGTSIYFIINKLRKINKIQLWNNKKMTYIAVIVLYFMAFSYIALNPKKSLFIHFIRQKHTFKFHSLWNLNPVVNPCLPEMTFPDDNMLKAIKFIKKNIKPGSIFAADLNESMQITTFQIMVTFISF